MLQGCIGHTAKHFGGTSGALWSYLLGNFGTLEVIGAALGHLVGSLGAPGRSFGGLRLIFDDFGIVLGLSLGALGHHF